MEMKDTVATLVWFAVTLTGGTWCAAADRIPPGPPMNTEPPTADAPKAPEASPNIQDPGMVKKPETKAAPGAVVTPPVVDPKMAVKPEQPHDQGTPRREPPAPPSPGPSR
jgi:hypothetical protein